MFSHFNSIVYKLDVLSATFLPPVDVFSMRCFSSWRFFIIQRFAHVGVFIFNIFSSDVFYLFTFRRFVLVDIFYLWPFVSVGFFLFDVFLVVVFYFEILSVNPNTEVQATSQHD